MRPAPPAARAKHQLRGVDAARKGQQGVRDVGPDHLVIGAAEVFHQHTLTCQMSRISTCETVTVGDVYREQIRALGARSDTGGPADQGLALRPARQCDDDPLPGFPV